MVAFQDQHKIDQFKDVQNSLKSTHKFLCSRVWHKLIEGIDISTGRILAMKSDNREVRSNMGKAYPNMVQRWGTGA